VEKSLAQLDAHREALVTLGYFERRDFSLTRRSLGRSIYKELRSFYTNAPLTDSHWTLGTVGEWASVVTVTARREDMPVWSNIVSRFNLQNTR
jgi:hypothetical protein